MTWYASHIYALPTPELVARVMAHPVLSQGAYLVTGLEGHEWPRPETRHSLPASGLLVVREICGAPVHEEEAHSELRWHQPRHPIVRWEELTGPETLPVITPPHLPLLVRDSVHEDGKPDAYPPRPFLRFLKALSAQTETDLVYYHHFSGMEMMAQQQFAWVFGTRERVYVQERMKVQAYLPGGGSVEASLRFSPQGLLLNVVLLPLGIFLPGYHGPHTPYFALHTRRFDWERHKIK